MAADKPLNKVSYLVKRGFSIAAIADFTRHTSDEVRNYRRSPDINEDFDSDLQDMINWVCERYGNIKEAQFRRSKRGKHLERLFNRSDEIQKNKEKRAKRPRSLLQSIRLQKIKMAAAI